MKLVKIILVFFNFIFCHSQEIKSPIYTLDEDKRRDFLKTEDINLFYHNSIQYIGEFKNRIEIKVNDFERYNPKIENNYSNDEKLKNNFFKNNYENLKIVVDATQTTPLRLTEIDYTKITNEEIDKILNGELNKEIPTKTLHYDGFPLTIFNLNTKDISIGFGNTVPLELEAQDRNGKWKSIYSWRRYTCGTGIKIVQLKPKQILTVFVPRYSGNFETKLRYKLKNIFSNEFYGKINEKLILEN